MPHSISHAHSNSPASTPETVLTAMTPEVVTGTPESVIADAAASATAKADSIAAFVALGLDAALARTAQELGYIKPTSVQAQAIPAALEGADLLASSQTGSGKTAAFVLPGLQRLIRRQAQAQSAGDNKGGRRPERNFGRPPSMLVLAPTRELALQVERSAMDLARGACRLRSITVVGGSSYALQLKRLREGVDMVVATPGRLIDHLNSGRIDLGSIEMLVLDEADRMLDMGFIDDIEMIAARLPKERQTMLFSATLDGVVGKLAARLTRNARRIEVTASAQRKADITQSKLLADDYRHKGKLLDALLRDPQIGQALVFTATKRSAEDVAGVLMQTGFSAAALHGDMHQGLRNRTVRALRDGHTRVLVATDVAARGIDVAGITHVINFDVPRQAEDYVHRIGRTGRAGRSGIAVTLVGPDDRRPMQAIERYTGQPVAATVIAGLEPKITHEPRKGSADERGRKKPWGGGGYGRGPARSGAGSSGSGGPGARSGGGGYRSDSRGEPRGPGSAARPAVGSATSPWSSNRPARSAGDGAARSERGGRSDRGDEGRFGGGAHGERGGRGDGATHGARHPRGKN